MFFHDRWIDWDQHDPAEREHWIYTCTRSIGIYIYLSLAASAVRPISPCTLVSYREWLATRIESMVVVFSLACIWKSYRFWSNDQAKLCKHQFWGPPERIGAAGSEAGRSEKKHGRKLRYRQGNGGRPIATRKCSRTRTTWSYSLTQTCMKHRRWRSTRSWENPTITKTIFGDNLSD